MVMVEFSDFLAGRKTCTNQRETLKPCSDRSSKVQQLLVKQFSEKYEHGWRLNVKIHILFSVYTS
jgi:hypothetical protein